MTLDELRIEKARLLEQARAISEAREAGDPVWFDDNGTAYTPDEADELTRAALYQVDVELAR